MFVCVDCHGVAPERQRQLDRQRRDDELAAARIKAKEKPIKFAPKLTKKQRQSLIQDYGQDAATWLEQLDSTPDTP